MYDWEDVLNALIRMRTNQDRWMLFYDLPPHSGFEARVLTSILAHATTVEECMTVHVHTNDERLEHETLLHAIQFIESESDFWNIYVAAPDFIQKYLLTNIDARKVRSLLNYESDDNQKLLELAGNVCDKRLKTFLLRYILGNTPTSQEVTQVYLMSRGIPELHDIAENHLAHMELVE